MKISSAIVAHHGIVAGMYDDLGIGKIIDEIIPKQGQHKLAHSVVLKAMVLISLRIQIERDCISSPNFSPQYRDVSGYLDPVSSSRRSQR